MTTLLAQIADDLGGIYDAVHGFAEVCASGGSDFLGVFSRGYFDADVGGTVSGMSSVPLLRTRDADAIAKGASVTIRGVAYTVVEVMPDGYGETIHRLHD